MVLFSNINAAAASFSEDELQAVSESQLFQISLPANANRINAQSIPAEINQTFDKITSGGKGKLRRGDSEVLLWGGGNFKKGGAENIANEIINSLKSAGWQFEVQGADGGMTVFTAIKQTGNTRAVAGFYGASDEVFIFAATEMFAVTGAASNAENGAASKNLKTSNSGKVNLNIGDLVGKWQTGSISNLQEKNLYTGQVTASNGSVNFYKFYADGRFENIGLINSTMYGCTTSLFNDKRGTIEVDGNQITLIPTKNFWRKTNSCAPSSNSERDYTLNRETFTYRTKTDEYGKAFICLANSKGETCYRREE